MTDTSRVVRAVNLLSEAEVRLGSARAGSEVYLLVDAALGQLRDELADLMLREASAEIDGLVDIHGLIDEVAGDDRRLGFA